MRDTHSDVNNLQIKISLLELEWYMRNQLLKDADIFGMANSIEIRVPLLSKKILINSFRKMISKPITKNTLASKYYTNLTFSKKKLGFSFPIKEWIIKETKTNSLNNLGWANYINKNFNDDGIHNI
jgi:asparagine synthase (glutamine-hydrolysing)